MNRPLILLSNDDGFRAKGLSSLRSALAGSADVVTVAPEYEQSASSHALSLHRPLRFTSHEPNLHSVEGTPADCVYTALFGGTRFLPRRPDLVLSGVNRGVNLAADVHYSGTVAAAREAALRGIAAIAFSADEEADLVAASDLAARIALGLWKQKVGRAPLLLNVNFPKGSDWPIAITRLGSRIYRDGVEFRLDPRGRDYLWLGGPPGFEHLADIDTDTGAFEHGYVGITPLALATTSEMHRDLVKSIVESIRPIAPTPGAVN
ncbi:MAG TPA: 5'/3'-nucleotidase SurE [Polyangiaceae bacterium]